jgi:hypothetical protein
MYLEELLFITCKLTLIPGFEAGGADNIAAVSLSSRHLRISLDTLA